LPEIDSLVIISCPIALEFIRRKKRNNDKRVAEDLAKEGALVLRVACCVFHDNMILVRI
jgi:hypothetical protein